MDAIILSLLCIRFRINCPQEKHTNIVKNQTATIINNLLKPLTQNIYKNLIINITKQQTTTNQLTDPPPPSTDHPTCIMCVCNVRALVAQ